MSGTKITTEALAAEVAATLIGPSDLIVRGINSIDGAGPDQLAFISHERYARQWPDLTAGAAFVSEHIDVPGHDPATRALLVVPDAEVAMLQVLPHFTPPPNLPDVGVSATATVADDVHLGRDVRIAPGVCIERGARLGDGVVVGAGSQIAAETVIGDGTILHPNVVVGARSIIGARCILHAGAVVGADGFGFLPNPDGPGVVRIPHIGHVLVGDDVEVGANACIDRGKYGPTVVGDGTKIDNQVQLGHNVRIGRSCMISGQSGFAGSVTLGDGVIVGAQVGIADHCHIGSGARLAARTAVMTDLGGGQDYGGAPAVPLREALRQVLATRKLPAFLARQRGSGANEST